MSKVYRPYEPNQMLLTPPSLREWLPDNHLVLFISDVVDQMDIGEIQDKHEKELRGYPAFHPRMMLKILIYGYCVGVRSSRKIAKRVEEDIAFRYLAAGNMPRFRTIAEFRQGNLGTFKSLFLQVLQLCRDSGLTRLGHVSLDGTKINANASKHKAMSYGRMEQEERRLKKEIEQMMREAAEMDDREDKKYGRDRRGDELPEELQRRETRLERIKAAKKLLEERAAAEEQAKSQRKQDDHEQDPPAAGGVARPPRPSTQINFTDPDSRIMRDSNKSFVQAYNAQAVVDSESQIIIASGVTNQSNDKNQVKPMVSAVSQNMQTMPDQLSADAGYFSEANVKWLVQQKVAPYIPPDKQKHNQRRLTARGPITPDMTVADRMRRKLSTRRGSEIYGKRKTIVEPVFGMIKATLGFRQFGLRGLDKAKAEWDLVCTCHNLLKAFRACATA